RSERRPRLVLGGAAITAPIAAAAQQPAGVPRVGLLMGADPRDEATKLDAFRGALAKLGYIDGQTVLIEVRYAMGQPDRFASLARELVVLAPSVIAVGGKRPPCRQPRARFRSSSFRSTILSSKAFSLCWPGPGATRPDLPKCRPSSIQNG